MIKTVICRVADGDGLPRVREIAIFPEGTRKTKEAAYVTAGRLIQHHGDFCLSKGIDFTRIASVRPHENTTLFCSAGMQQYKPLFSDPSYIGTVANSQACLRMGDSTRSAMERIFCTSPCSAFSPSGK
ncbi:hypothetical protein FHX03_005702 [Rhizobium sp. BK456]|nr:hypothetical protein [Rhizobium sp. BK456]